MLAGMIEIIDVWGSNFGFVLNSNKNVDDDDNNTTKKRIANLAREEK